MPRFHQILLIVLVLVVGLFLFWQAASPTQAFAAAITKESGLVPCGRLSGTPDEMKPCKPCDILKLADRVKNFIFLEFVPVVATLFFLIAGFLVLLGGANKGLVATGQNMFKTTVWGLLIIFGAWLIANTVIKSLAGEKPYGKNWNKVTCTNPPEPRAPSGGGGGSPGGGGNTIVCDTTPDCPSGQTCVDNVCESSPTGRGPNIPAGCFDTNGDGQITEQDCGDPQNDACSLCGAPGQKFACDSQNQCVPDPSGKYITTNCDGTCEPLTNALAIDTASLPDAVSGQLYSQPINARGGMPSYTYSISAGALPAGLRMSSDGVITGKTAAPVGTYEFTVKVTDSTTPTKLEATRPLSIKVDPADTKFACSPGGCAPSSSGTFTSSTCDNTCLAQSNALAIDTASLPDATVNQAYSSTMIVRGGITPYTFSISAGSLPPGLAISQSGTISGKPTKDGSFDFTVQVTDSTRPKALNATRPLSITVKAVVTLACVFNGTDYSTFNLCSGQGRPGGCGTSTCSKYADSINRYAGGAATASLLKAMMVIESDCNISAGTATSYGLMQLGPATARRFQSRCGVTDTITPSWLRNPANADKSICIAAAYVNSIAAGVCGPAPRNIYAGYNAGPGNCTASNDCAGETSCSNETVKKWECPYDNPQHTACNTRMYETKQGATYINYCLNNLGF